MVGITKPTPKAKQSQMAKKSTAVSAAEVKTVPEVKTELNTEMNDVIKTDDAPAAVVDDATTRLSDAIDKVQAILQAAKEILPKLRSLHKEINKLQKKEARKQNRKAAIAGVDGCVRKLSGFAVPTALSKELCDFLGLASDTMLARTEVTRMLTKYIKDNGLQVESDKRTIKPDVKLRDLLKLKDGETLTYFNLQTHIKHHFVKA
jgi:chromatin remodeling complex protein RSC6